MSKITALKTDLKASTATTPQEKVSISPPNFKYATVEVKGTAPFMSNAMSSAARAKMREGQEQGSANRSMKRRKDPKDFEAQFKGSLHISSAGWYGVPCSAFRGAMIEACKTVGFPMTRAKLFLFVVAEGRDESTGEGLVQIHGEPVRDERIGKLATGVSDILTRARFDEWSARVTIKWDGDAFQSADIVNLLSRAGQHVGIGAGRPGSSNSAGIGMGTFEVIQG